MAGIATPQKRQGIEQKFVTRQTRNFLGENVSHDCWTGLLRNCSSMINFQNSNDHLATYFNCHFMCYCTHLLYIDWDSLSQKQLYSNSDLSTERVFVTRHEIPRCESCPAVFKSASHSRVLTEMCCKYCKVQAYTLSTSPVDCLQSGFIIKLRG